jgi:AIPR protein
MEVQLQRPASNPAEILATLYGKFGARLLEQNVRSFLQARGKVNQGIRSTILNEPHMFFAYNNGITATAQEVIVEGTEAGLQITRIRDLQIVNGGQTTASLFHTKRKDKAALSDIFVQMKLSVIDSVESEQIVPRISEYANTQSCSSSTSRSDRRAWLNIWPSGEVRRPKGRRRSSAIMPTASPRSICSSCRPSRSVCSMVC